MRARSMLLAWMVAAGCERDPASADPPAPTPMAETLWRDVTSAAELSTLAAEARANHKALLLDVRAKWCLPCKQLDVETLSNPEVEEVLRERFILARLDVTDPAPAAVTLQDQVGADTLPKLLLWAMNAADARAFAAGEPPPATNTISTFVTAAEFLPVVEAF